ncbi:MAG: molybdate ABC transporter substrate-binding protein, partial [Campylobacteraceae bacterium]|nr:molybdate ABC transporter substrate-binding protein [Campylobacteraceae bacterium]
FRTQIKNGADFDIFLSADVGFAEEIFNANLSTKEPKIYAQGALALFSTKEIDFGKGLELLKNNSIKTISIANPQTAPYGKASVEAMESTKVYDDIKNKLIFAESIGQVTAQVLSAADIGFVAKSTFYTDNMKKYIENVNWISIDISLFNPINQAMVIIKSSKNLKDTELFYNFLLGEDGKKILQDFGYNTPAAETSEDIAA